MEKISSVTPSVGIQQRNFNSKCWFQPLTKIVHLSDICTFSEDFWTMCTDQPKSRARGHMKGITLSSLEQFLLTYRSELRDWVAYMWMCVWGEMVDSYLLLNVNTMFNANCDFCVAINCNCITSIAISFFNITLT